jgi:glycosyltransferase involved in cell wall biosynthesis
VVTFSCIITCFNREDTIQRAMFSILNQTFQDFELIVVDDGSYDNSVTKITAINDERVTLFKHVSNLGQNAALNTGISLCHGKLVAFLDSDDVWVPNYLDEFYLEFSRKPNLDFSYCRLVNGPKWNLEGINIYDKVLYQGYLSSMITIVVKLEKIKSIGGFDVKYKICQDDDFCFRLSKKSFFSVIKKDLAIIIGTENSMTKNKINVLDGWHFLFVNYKSEIISNCGSKTYSKHLMTLSRMAIKSGFCFKSLRFMFQGIFYYYKPGKNKFNFSIYIEIFELIRILKCNLVENKIKKNSFK